MHCACSDCGIASVVCQVTLKCIGALIRRLCQLQTKWNNIIKAFIYIVKEMLKHARFSSVGRQFCVQAAAMENAPSVMHN